MMTTLVLKRYRFVIQAPTVQDRGLQVVHVYGIGDHLFIGGRALAGSYPVAAASRLLRNAGGKFTDATPAFFSKLGIVTDAIWTDLNNDQKTDLVVTTEWGPVRCLINQSGQLVDRTDEWKLGQHLAMQVRMASRR